MSFHLQQKDKNIRQEQMATHIIIEQHKSNENLPVLNRPEPENSVFPNG